MSRAQGAAPKGHHSAGSPSTLVWAGISHSVDHNQRAWQGCKTSQNVPVIGYWRLDTIPLRPARLRGTRDTEMSSDPSFRGVLQDVTRTRGVLPRDTIPQGSVDDNQWAWRNNLVDAYQSFVTGGYSSRTEIFLPGCIARCHAHKGHAPKGHRSAGFC